MFRALDPPRRSIPAGGRFRPDDPELPLCSVYFPTSSSPSNGSCPFPSASTYPQLAVWDFRPVRTKSPATDTIPAFSSLGRAKSVTTGRSMGCSPITWFTSQHPNNPTFEPTISFERAFGLARDLFVEYVGIIRTTGGLRRFETAAVPGRLTKLQQLDFHLGLGLNSSSPDHFVGIGYSFRFDGLLGGSIANSP
jgi:hypothetical protein